MVNFLENGKPVRMSKRAGTFITLNTEGKASANVSIGNLSTNNENFTYTIFIDGNDVSASFGKTPSITYREN